MDLVTELRRRLSAQDTQLALSELPARIQSAATYLGEAARLYVLAAQKS
jgi:hypothetical protein